MSKAKPKELKAPEDELPEAISITTLRWLLGDVTIEYVNQLERQGVLEKSARGMYRTASVRAYIRTMRHRALGPAGWNDARTELARERASAARMTRLERESELLPRDVVESVVGATFTIVRQNFLGMGTRLAPQLHQAPSVPAVQLIVDQHVREVLSALADSSEVEIMAHIHQEAARRDGRKATSPESR